VFCSPCAIQACTECWHYFILNSRVYQVNQLYTLNLCQSYLQLLYLKTTLILEVSSVITNSITWNIPKQMTHNHAIRNVQLLIHKVTFLQACHYDQHSNIVFFFLGWGETESTCYIDHYLAFHSSPWWWWVWRSQWNENWQGKLK
jgi:hypothetical protein